MASARRVEDRLRQQIRAERERRGWSQEYVGARLGIGTTTVAKIEVGPRGVRAEELAAFADLFLVSADVLLGRGSGSDVVWAASKLATNAHRFVGEVLRLQERVAADVRDLHHYAEQDGRGDSVVPLMSSGNRAYAALIAARDALIKLAEEFPIGGLGTRTTSP